jgi:hypothetical protein
MPETRTETGIAEKQVLFWNSMMSVSRQLAGV